VGAYADVRGGGGGFLRDVDGSYTSPADGLGNLRPAGKGIAKRLLERRPKNHDNGEFGVLVSRNLKEISGPFQHTVHLHLIPRLAAAGCMSVGI